MALRYPAQVHQYSGDDRTVDAASEPVTATELRTHLRTDSTTLGDTEANALIMLARQYIEQVMGIAMIEQTWTMALDGWPNSRDVWWYGTRDGSINSLDERRNSIIEFPRYPLSSVTSVQVYYTDDSSNTYTTVSSTTISDLFHVDTRQQPGRMTPRFDAAWPIASRPINSIIITYKAGYGALAASVPEPLQRAVLQTAAYLYTHRGDDCEVSDAWNKSGARDLAGIYGVRRI